MSILMALWAFFGWKWLLVLPALYGAMLIGANSPATFKRSKAGLERIAQDAAAKARALTLRGK
jgi:hypothetical protein